MFGGIGRALSHRDYLLHWSSNGINTMGRWMYRIANFAGLPVTVAAGGALTIVLWLWACPRTRKLEGDLEKNL